MFNIPTAKNTISVSVGLWLVCICAPLLGFSYKKAHLRAVFRHLNPGTRKSSRNVDFSYMRGQLRVSELSCRTARMLDGRLLGYTGYLTVAGRLFAQPAFQKSPQYCRRVRSCLGTTPIWFHTCKPCNPGSGWGRSLWSACYPGLGDCGLLLGVG